MNKLSKNGQRAILSGYVVKPCNVMGEWFITSDYHDPREYIYIPQPSFDVNKDGPIKLCYLYIPRPSGEGEEKKLCLVMKNKDFQIINRTDMTFLETPYGSVWAINSNI